MRAPKKKARKAYEAFHQEEVMSRKRATVPKIPRVVWCLGELVAVVYKRPSPNEPTAYEHKFKRPRPLLCSDPKGKRLYIVGGGYRVRRVGIVR